MVGRKHTQQLFGHLITTSWCTYNEESLKTFILKILEGKPSGEEILNKIYEFSARLAQHISICKQTWTNL